MRPSGFSALLPASHDATVASFVSSVTLAAIVAGPEAVGLMTRRNVRAAVECESRGSYGQSKHCQCG